MENLPLYTALVVAIAVTSAARPAIDALALVLLGARMGQTVTHVALNPSRTTVAVRFAFFFTQVVAMVAIGGVDRLVVKARDVRLTERPCSGR